METGVPTGWFRAVSYIPNVFAVESVMDEAARPTRSSSGSRTCATGRAMRPCCVKRRNERVGPAAAGWCRARHRDEPAYDSYVAVVARVVRKDGAVRVEKLTCVADCGIAVSPAGVDEQLYGGLMWGSATRRPIASTSGTAACSSRTSIRIA